MTISAHNFEYKKNDRQLFTNLKADVTKWRQVYSVHTKKLIQENDSVNELRQNISRCRHRLHLLEKLRKAEENLLSDLKDLSTTKDETRLDESLFQLSETLSSFVNKKAGDHEKLFNQYNKCLEKINAELIAARELRKTIKNYKKILSELKAYCPASIKKSYQTHLDQLNISTDDQINYLKELLTTFSTQHNTFIEKKVLLGQDTKYYGYVVRSCGIIEKQSSVFYLLLKKITLSRPQLIEKDLWHSHQSFTELEKFSYAFHTAFQDYNSHSEDVNLDQKFDQFNRYLKKLEKNLTDLTDENNDELYAIMFDKLQNGIQAQLSLARALLKIANAYLSKLKDHQLLSPEINANAGLLENIISILNHKIDFLNTHAEKTMIGRNKILSTPLEEKQAKVEFWKQKIPCRAQQLDGLIIKLKLCESLFNEMETKLVALNHTIDKFPIYTELRKQICSLLKEVNKYKKALHVLEKKTHKQVECFNSQMEECKTKLNFVEKKNTFKKIFAEFASEYGTILKTVLDVEEKLNKCLTFIANAHRESKGSFEKESKLCVELMHQLEKDKKHFAKCYQTFTVESSVNHQKEQHKIMRVNCLLKNIYDNLTMIEGEFAKIHCDTSGINLFKSQFASILINNTVHEEDLDNTIKKYLEWIHFIEHTDAHHIQSDAFDQAIRRLRTDIIKVKNELVSWRTSTTYYAISTTMRIVSPAIFTMLSIVIPGAQLLPDTLTQNALLMDQLQNATEMVVKVGSKQAYTKVSESLSPTERGIGFDDEEFSAHRVKKHKEEKVSLAGIRSITHRPSENCKLSLDLSYLWKETLYVKMRKVIFNKSMFLTGVSASISLAIGLTGVVAPLAIPLLMGGTAVGTISMTAYDEYQQCVLEAKTRFQSEERLKKIDEMIRSLEILPERHIFNKYYHFTMTFIQSLIMHMNTEKEHLNVNMSLLHMKEYLAKINTAQPPMNHGINIEVKSQDVAPLLEFLKTESEEPESLIASIQFLNSNAFTGDQKDIEKHILNARQRVIMLEDILNTLHDNCAIGKTPLQISLDILVESELRSKSHQRFFQPIEMISVVKIKQALTLLLGRIDLVAAKDFRFRLRATK